MNTVYVLLSLYGTTDCAAVNYTTHGSHRCFANTLALTLFFKKAIAMFPDRDTFTPSSARNARAAAGVRSGMPSRLASWLGGGVGCALGRFRCALALGLIFFTERRVLLIITGGGESLFFSLPLFRACSATASQRGLDVCSKLLQVHLVNSFTRAETSQILPHSLEHQALIGLR